MEEVTLNITFKINASSVVDFERWLEYHYEVKDSQILPDDSKLYQEDKYYKKLKKQIKQLKIQAYEYYNRNQHKYKN